MTVVIDRSDLEFIAKYVPELWGKLTSSSLQMEEELLRVANKLKWALSGNCTIQIGRD